LSKKPNGLEGHWQNLIYRIQQRYSTSDLHYRTVVQPHINQHIHEPLLRKRAHIHFLDIKEHEGVDITLDLADAGLPASAFTETYDLIICCNILEHLADRDGFIRNLLKYTHAGTYLMLTVSRVYPRHNDPIDTMYRPTVKELENFIYNNMECDVVTAKELVITDKQYYQVKAGRWLNRINLLRLRRILRWYLKPLRWRISCILLVFQR
jgi:hypothetical protein